MEAFLDFEKPIATLEKKLDDLRELAQQGGVDLKTEINALEKRVNGLLEEIYSKLTPWQKVQLSRHPNRPHTRDYIETLFPSFMELHGDRCFSDDHAIMGGIALWPPVAPSGAQASPGDAAPAAPASENQNGMFPQVCSTAGQQSILILGHQKGRTTKQKMTHNFGMAKPEGYRRAIRLMELAERARMPILTFIDTPGAYPGLETEERGQAQAIAECIRCMFSLTVPVVTIVIGEGGSGGALAIGVGNRVLMQEYSTYSVISPEGCASILWSDSKMAERASHCLKLSPQDLKQLDVIDGIIREPVGGAQRNWQQSFELMRETLLSEMGPYFPALAPGGASASGKATTTKKTKAPTKKRTAALSPEALRTERIEKFRKMGTLNALGRTSEHA